MAERGSGRFSSPSLGVIVTANIEAFQRGIGQIPTITKSAFSQAAQHIQAFNNLVTNSVAQLGAKLQGIFSSIPNILSRMTSTIRNYFRRTPMDDLGIPELAGRLDPSKFMTQMSSIAGMAKATALKIGQTFSEAFSSTTDFLKSSFSKAWDSIVGAATPMATKITSVFKTAYDKIAGYFRKTPADDLGI